MVGIGILLVSVFFIFFYYNIIIFRKNRVQIEHAQIETMLKLRTDILEQQKAVGGRTAANLQSALAEIHQSLSELSDSYNSSVVSYNTAIEHFPTRLLAVTLRLQRAKPFEVPTEN